MHNNNDEAPFPPPSSNDVRHGLIHEIKRRVLLTPPTLRYFPSPPISIFPRSQKYYAQLNRNRVSPFVVPSLFARRTSSEIDISRRVSLFIRNRLFSMILEHLPSILRYNRLFRVQSLSRGEIYVEGERVIRKIRNTMFCDKKSDSMGREISL